MSKIALAEFTPIEGLSNGDTLQTAAQLQLGPWISPTARLITYSPDEWETFIDEWVFSLKQKYSDVLRYTGSGDMGIDVAGFSDQNYLNGIWDNFQCKHYGAPLGPGVLWPEVGKILWYSFSKHYAPPRACYFVAPRGTSTKSTRLLGDQKALKDGLIKAWEKSVRTHIASAPVEFEGEFAKYVLAFDFSIFRPMSIRTVLEQHQATQYYLPRFGGGLPTRPRPGLPPDAPAGHESGYVAKLLEAYADHLTAPTLSIHDLHQHPKLEDHLKRSREAFYQAESLRIFVRDKVEPGTFENLQSEIFGGVIDTRNAEYKDGYECVVQVTKAAQDMDLGAHPLSASVFPTDKRGICHQLANDDRLGWLKS
ncbi:ABC-three component system protein [Devosia sp. XGJD_8]|uniref:ABC-three component system protein n=1 Tax=Devosia sp. XGJD_8 TaxID=3391187 RepID=UPI003984ED38